MTTANTVKLKFTVNKAELLAELNKLAPFVEKKTTIPILANFKLHASYDSLTITATDLDCALIVELPCKIKGVGEVTVPAHKFVNTIKALKTLEAAEVTVTEMENYRVQVTCGPMSVKLPGMAPASYPVLAPWPEAGPSYNIRADILTGLMDRTLYAIAQQESRYTLNGGLLILAHEWARLVTTDGHRLACVTHGEYDGVELNRTLVSKEALGKLRKLAEKSDPVEITRDDSHIFFRAGNWQMMSRVMTGQFPNYEAVLPKSDLKYVEVPARKLRETVSRVAQFADERSKAIRLTFENGELIVSADSTEKGDAKESLPSVGWDGADKDGVHLSIGFSAEYVLDLLATITNGDSVRIGLRDANSAGLWQSVEDKGRGYDTRVVIIPMRI